ncbi:MAG: biotin/lipoyl-binding protein [Bryobacteraceae bacterium]|nr:biotin/lipoyl-binding protein [Bryobacteraceae bacterium]
MKLKITIDNKTYEVDVEAFEPEPPRPQLPPSYMIQPGAARVPAAPAPAAPSTGGEAVDEDKVCRSPINGIVVKVLAQPGQQIQPGDTLLVLEAMKMETNITAPIAGKVAKVNVNAGDSVQSGAVLVEFE